MRFAGDKAEKFLGHGPDLGMVANQALQNQSDERASKHAGSRRSSCS